MREQHGQATVELVGILPLVMVVAALAWQAVVVGQALWSSGSAARAAARAQAVGGDASAAARGALPGPLRAGLRVRRAGDGVRVAVGVPAVLAGGRLTTVHARAGFPPQ